MEENTQNYDEAIRGGIPMKERDLVFLDLELTGLNLNHEIIEIGGLIVDQKDLSIKEEFDFKIKPVNLDMADPISLKMVHYSEGEWKDSISLIEGLRKLEKLAYGKVLIGFNSAMDWSRIEKAYLDNGITMPPFFYLHPDIAGMCYFKFLNNKEVNKFSLAEICKFLGIERDKSKEHNALEDARASLEVYKKIVTI